MTGDVPVDADANYVYTNRQPYWGDSDSWVNVDMTKATDGSNDILVALPPRCCPLCVAVWPIQTPLGQLIAGQHLLCTNSRTQENRV